MIRAHSQRRRSDPRRLTARETPLHPPCPSPQPLSRLWVTRNICSIWRRQRGRASLGCRRSGTAATRPKFIARRAAASSRYQRASRCSLQHGLLPRLLRHGSKARWILPPSRLLSRRCALTPPSFPSTTDSLILSVRRRGSGTKSSSSGR